MAGLCAAIVAARRGAKTVLVHDRSVLGGNASSEVRMWICGCHGKHNKEAGILEEIQLENLYRNGSLNYSVWDSVLFGKARFQPGLTLLLDTTCNEAAMEGGRIASIRAWQSPSQTWHTIRAKVFIDCSGDSILAPLTGAAWRRGREARAEFDEDIEPNKADEKTMGNSILVQLRRTDQNHTYVPPTWAYKFETPDDLPNRMNGVQARNFWWLELGGLQDTIKDADRIRDDLMRTAYGVWDYIKNRAPAKAEAANWAIEWIGSLPGKRESRRYIGDHVLTQNDVRAGGKFTDIIAYGGWSMDDHHPAGLLYPGKPTIFHAAPTPYGIPYRTLYSRNVSNLLFAGRNISVTHAALSSTRVMGTCSLLGQAAGTAAALCVKHSCSPRGVYESHLSELQNTLMDDDQWLPGMERPISPLARAATVTAPGENFESLLDGLDRDREDEDHAWRGPVGSVIEFRWKQAVKIGGLRFVFDSNLGNDKRMPCSYPQYSEKPRVPASLVKSFRIESAEQGGGWRTVYREENNYQRLVKLPLALSTQAIRIVPESTWGDPVARIFAAEPVEQVSAAMPAPEEGPLFREVVKAVDPKDLAPPDSGMENPLGKNSASA
jgi:hypothetical protein